MQKEAKGGKCMEKKDKFFCAGSLKEELDEMEKVFHNEESVVVEASTTARCGTFLTIICC